MPQIDVSVTVLSFLALFFCKCYVSSNCENRCTKEAMVANSDESNSESDSDAF